MTTICGIDQDHFKRRATPIELAKVIAGWHSDEQAEFIVCLAEALRDRCGGSAFMQVKAIADCIIKVENDPLGGDGTDLLKEIVHHLLLMRSEAGEYSLVQKREARS